MAGKDFFANPIVKNIINNFEKEKLNFCFAEDDWDSEFFDSSFDQFAKQTGKTEEFLLDVLKNDYDDFLVYVKDQSKDDEQKAYAFVFGSDLLLFSIFKYNLNMDGPLLSGYKKSYVKLIVDNYNKLFSKDGETIKIAGKVEKTQNPYKETNKKELSKEYFEIANNQLPEILSEGFVKAIKAFKKADSDESEICCILDIGKKSKMVFVYGDGSECDDSNDESVFFKYPCDEILQTCKLMVDALETLNMRQESIHWLIDAIKIAEEKSAFKDFSMTIYGNVQYGDHELDVIYEC
jgi:hypothetical protein